nr:MAG TPA: hypothetical protein [Caudoviricetes sp.]
MQKVLHFLTCQQIKHLPQEETLLKPLFAPCILQRLHT